MSDSPEKGIERFAPEKGPDGWIAGLAPSPTGYWVRYEDHIRERDEAVARERERVRGALAEVPQVQATSGLGTSSVRIYETETGPLLRVSDVLAALNTQEGSGE